MAFPSHLGFFSSSSNYSTSLSFENLAGYRWLRETKQQPSRASPGQLLGCSLDSPHFWCWILWSHPVLVFRSPIDKKWRDRMPFSEKYCEKFSKLKVDLKSTLYRRQSSIFLASAVCQWVIFSRFRFSAPLLATVTPTLRSCIHQSRNFPQVSSSSWIFSVVCLNLIKCIFASWVRTRDRL